MRKGELTRQKALEASVGLASRLGLGGLTIASLADELGLSKSGLFAHFQSKEALQVQTLEAAAERFTDAVIRPALAAPRGVPRLRELCERWLVWPRVVPQEGGCLFVAAAVELDDQPGPARDTLVRIQRDWLDFLAGTVRIAVAEGHFQPKTDAAQLAFEIYGVMLSTHHAHRLLGDPKAASRARRALDDLIARHAVARH
ncbi:MAG: TetR/AcrR family transcriptional regulator [Vicinamibacteria bacterium]|nr:TetR/AcrR family transcriptional regulator [Vicinamibacteria bacterium]